ncbi:MAG: hypothetical protein ACTSVX_06315 [Promethearchaeota archaeon]
MIELGITSGYLIPSLKRKGLRLLMPLHSTENKSIVSKTLEKKPPLRFLYISGIVPIPCYRGSCFWNWY